MAKDLEIGSVVVTRNGKLAIITGFRPANHKYPCLYKFGAVPTTYKGNPDEFRAVLGVVDIALFEAANAQVAPPVPQLGTVFGVPDALKGVKVGDTITVRVHGRPTQVTYRGYFPNRRKMPLAFTMKGREYKAPLSLLAIGAPVAPAAPAGRRSEEVILGDIKTAYCNLSPENLTCDGELPAYRVAQRRAQYNADLKRLFSELGREVSEEEAFAA